MLGAPAVAMATAPNNTLARNNVFIVPSLLYAIRNVQIYTDCINVCQCGSEQIKTVLPRRICSERRKLYGGLNPEGAAPR